MPLPLYLDYAATTPVDPRVAEVMGGCLTLDGNFGNPASRSHLYGWKAEEAVENARRYLADLINADPREIIWTSGATESNNLALKGAAHANKGRGRHIVTSLTEHKAVLDVCRQLEKDGFEVSYLQPAADGLIAPEAIEAELRDDTILVSLMQVNNEIGVVADIAQVGAMCRARGVLLHVDAAQSLGKIPVDVKALQVDLLSISGHKFYGPKGIGALFVRRSPDVVVEAQIHGGGHERGFRSGTLATHQVAGIGEAARIAAEELPQEADRLRQLRNHFWQGIESLGQVRVNGSLEQRVPGILNLAFGYVEGETLLMSLRELAVSSGSACTSASVEPSYVLRAIGLDESLAHASIRFSFGRFTTREDVDSAVTTVRKAVSTLRAQSPQWRRLQRDQDQTSSARTRQILE